MGIRARARHGLATEPVAACVACVLVLAPADRAGAEALTQTFGRVELKAVGYVQYDGRAFPAWDAGAGQRNDGFDVRHMRGGVRLTRGPLSGQMVVDVAGFANRALGDDVSPMFVPRQRFKDAYVELFVRRLRLRAGHFKLPVSREFLVAEQRTDFIERSLFCGGLAPGRDWGATVEGRIAVAHGLRGSLGLFAGDNWAEPYRAGTTGAGRLVLEPWSGLQIGVSGTFGAVHAVGDGETAPRPKGLQGKSASGWVFFRRPAVDGDRRRLGADLQYVAPAFTLTAELLASREERAGLPAAEGLSPVAGRGFATSALWRVRGRRPRGAAEGAHAALELAIRYELLHFDDGRGVSPSSRSFTAGIGLEPRPWLRLMGNAVVDRYGDDARAPEVRRGTYVTLLGRLQLAVP